MIKNFNEFLNEGLFRKKNPLDPEIRRIFDEIKDNFNMSDLRYDHGHIKYTHNESIHIKMFIVFDDVYLYVNKEKINCSKSLKKEIWKFFEKKIDEKSLMHLRDI